MRHWISAVVAAVTLLLPLSSASAADCSAMIKQFNTLNGAKAEMNRKAKAAPDCSPAAMKSYDALLGLWREQVALRKDLDRSCRQQMKGGNSVAELENLQASVQSAVKTLKGVCGLEADLKGKSDEDDEILDELNAILGDTDGEKKWAALSPSNEAQAPLVWATSQEEAADRALAACQKVSQSCGSRPAVTDQLDWVLVEVCCDKPKRGCLIVGRETVPEAEANAKATFVEAGYSVCKRMRALSAKDGSPR